MKRDLQGQYAETTVGDETIRAFIPSPLPPVPPLDLAGEREALVERATLAIGRLDSVGILLPDPQLFLYAYVRKEAVLSSQIEGTQSSLSDLLLFELDEQPRVPIDDVAEVSNHVTALEAFIHGRTSSGADLPPMPTLIKAALAHVQFETIHPFLDGNGRLGRLLIALLFHESGMLRQPLLYLSLYLKQHRSAYYALLDCVRKDGDWEAWIEFFLEGVEQTAQGAVNTAQRLAALFQADHHRMSEVGRGAASASRLLSALRERPVCNLNQLCEQIGMTFPTASKAMGKLIELEIARELTGQRRNRVFVYNAYLGILNEGGEPL